MEFENNWKYKTLESLEKENWTNSIAEHPSEDFQQIGKTPLKNLSIDDLTLLIWQNIGLKYAIPMAMKHLKKDVMINGKESPSFLLEEVLLSDEIYWKSNLELWNDVLDLVNSNYRNIINQTPKKIWRMEMENAIDNFREINKT